MRTMLAWLVCAGAMVTGAAIAQNPGSPPGPQVVPLTAKCVYYGWRATDVMGAPMISRSDDDLGTVRNILVGSTGKAEALIVEAASSRSQVEFVFRVPWQKVQINEIPEKVVADLGTKSPRPELFSSKDNTPPNEFSVTQVIGDYARLQAGLAYGYVNDVVFSDEGRMMAILVTRDSPSGGGTYAFGFPGSIGPWNPSAGYYGLPYVTTEQANAAAIRIKLEHFAEVNETRQDKNPRAHEGWQSDRRVRRFHDRVHRGQQQCLGPAGRSGGHLGWRAAGEQRRERYDFPSYVKIAR